MDQSDLPAVDELRRIAGWNQTPRDWARLLALAPQGCFLAEVEGQVVGSVTTTSYGSDLAWIGMMLVHPQFRRLGLGRALMKRALEHLKDLACVKLDATPAGLPLYTQLGFVPEWTLQRWLLPAESRAAVAPTAKLQTRSLGKNDWEQVATLDARVLGVSRSPILRSFIEDSTASAVWPAEGPAIGWGLLRVGANARYLGPVVCPVTEGAACILNDLLANHPEAAVFWDIPDQNTFATEFARQCGFQPVRPLTRMRLGSVPDLGGPLAQIAIADPAVG